VISARKLAAAYVLDWFFGDPEWFPHPVRGIGFAVGAGTRAARPTATCPAVEFVQGAALSAGVVGASAVVARGLCAAGPGMETLLAWTTLATRSLLNEACHVLDALEAGDLSTARLRLARIVGRDTADLDSSEVVRAVVETVAESTCDGIVAPLLYLASGGVPAAFAYKAVNTLDSMIGHREVPYTYFGRFAARLDDLCNFLPARLTVSALSGAAMLSGLDGKGALRVAWRDGRLHVSPNAGRVEAAMAGALGVRLGGVNYYDRKPSRGAVLNPLGAQPQLRHGRAALRLAAVASALIFGVLLGAAVWSERKRRSE